MGEGDRGWNPRGIGTGGLEGYWRLVKREREPVGSSITKVVGTGGWENFFQHRVIFCNKNGTN